MIETAGILIGAIVVFTVVAADSPSPSSPSAAGSLAFGNVAFTGRQCLPECLSVETFVQTTELSPNDWLVASSNS